MRQVVGLGIGPREGVLLGANLGRAIVTIGDFTAYVSDSAATRPSSQITLGRLVTLCYIYVIFLTSFCSPDYIHQIHRSHQCHDDTDGMSRHTLFQQSFPDIIL